MKSLKATNNWISKQQLKQMSAKPKIETPKYQGKGTPARLNTAAEKHMFNSKHS